MQSAWENLARLGYSGRVPSIRVQPCSAQRCVRVVGGLATGGNDLDADEFHAPAFHFVELERDHGTSRLNRSSNTPTRTHRGQSPSRLIARFRGSGLRTGRQLRPVPSVPALRAPASRSTGDPIAAISSAAWRRTCRPCSRPSPPWRPGLPWCCEPAARPRGGRPSRRTGCRARA